LAIRPIASNLRFVLFLIASRAFSKKPIREVKAKSCRYYSGWLVHACKAFTKSSDVRVSLWSPYIYQRRGGPEGIYQGEQIF
jgi:hypothetical protein